jgi:hypothetical protein
MDRRQRPSVVRKGKERSTLWFAKNVPESSKCTEPKVSLDGDEEGEALTSVDPESQVLSPF